LVELGDISGPAVFDATDYLDSEETIAEFYTAALEDENPEVFLTAISCRCESARSRHNCNHGEKNTGDVHALS
jgi:hypothetical protein